MNLVRFVLDPTVSGLLLGIGVAGLLLEMLSLSLIAGTVAAAALALFFVAHVAGGGADPLVIGLAVLGLLGIVLELHVMPGHVVAGVVGVLALLAAVVLSFGVPFVVVAMPSLAIAIVVAVVIIVLARRIVPERVFAKRLTLGDADDAGGFAAPDYRALVGKHGFAASFLRPAGVAAIDGQRIDVLSEGDFVPAGTAVVVTRVEGARIFVRPEGVS
jgi:membrane-bound serine protease (ClpP class)